MSKSIIQILPALNQGGVERGTIEIAKALQEAKIENYVISSGGKMVDELTKLGVEHISLPVSTKNPIKMWLNSRKMIQIFKDKNAGLIHVRSRAPAWSVNWACKKMDIPYIATYHGRYGIKPALKKVYNRVMLKGKKVIAVSEFIKDHLMKEYQIPESFIRVIPRGADIDVFDPNKISDSDKQTFLTNHNIRENQPVITLVGRLSRIKGHSILLNAVKQMKHTQFTLLLIGGNPKGDYEQEIKQKLSELPPNVDVKIFAVSGSEMPLVYAVSDICVQPSLVPESFGRSIAEAEAMGCIVVAAAHGGACELIESEKTGFLTPVGDSEKLAQVLDKIMGMDEQNRKLIGQEAQQKIRSNYSIQKMCERTLELYREFLT